MRVLLIEDDSATAQSIELMLKSESFNVYTTDLGEEGVDLGKLYDYDIILLDLNLPDMSGFEVLRSLRVSKVKTPILILTGLGGIEDKVRGLGFGADARIVYANACGHEMLADAGVLHGPTGKLVSSGGMATNRSLQDAFAAAAAGDDVNAKEMAVPLVARNGEQWVAHVLPLTSGARRKAGTFYAAIAAVFVRRAAPNLLSPLEAIADAYRLTAAEMRVLMTIVNVGGVPEAADVLGISETTVKTHLQHVFEKTRTRRQADLIKLVATHMNPLTH